MAEPKKPTYKDVNDKIRSKENLYYAASELFVLPDYNSTIITRDYI